MDMLARKVCKLEGCYEGMPCFGGSGKGMCIEAIARYNELRKKELLEGAKQKDARRK